MFVAAALLIHFLFFIDSSALYAADTQGSGQFDEFVGNLQPGEWYEVANSRLYDVSPQPPPGGCTSRTSAIMVAWGGGAYDTKRDRLIIFGGGHADYAGNEVYVFDINNLSWTRLTNPSPTTHCDHSLDVASGQSDARWNGDGTPVSRHTYSGILYLPSPIDRFFAAGGSKWIDMLSDELPWFFDFVTLKWDFDRAVHNMAPTKLTSPASVYDPLTGHIWVHSNDVLYEFDPNNNSWTARANNWRDPYYTSVLDTKRHWLLLLGAGSIYYYNLSGSGKLVRNELPTTGATEIVDTFAPGVTYDAANDQLVAWSGITKRKALDASSGWIPSTIGNNVYTLNLETLQWSMHPPVGSVAPPATPTTGIEANNGTWGRWQYIPSKKVYVGVNSVKGNVYFYRLSQGNGVIPHAPTPPTNLKIR